MGESRWPVRLLAENVKRLAQRFQNSNPVGTLAARTLQLVLIDASCNAGNGPMKAKEYEQQYSEALAELRSRGCNDGPVI